MGHDQSHAKPLVNKIIFEFEFWRRSSRVRYRAISGAGTGKACCSSRLVVPFPSQEGHEEIAFLAEGASRHWRKAVMRRLALAESAQFCSFRALRFSVEATLCSTLARALLNVRRFIFPREKRAAHPRW